MVVRCKFVHVELENFNDTGDNSLNNEYTLLVPKKNNVQKNRLIELILQSKNGTDTQVARVIHAMYEKEFVASTANINTISWYLFKNHRWNHVIKEFDLKSRISDEVYHEYGKVINNLTRQVTEDENDLNNIIETKDLLIKIQAKLLRTTFKKTLVRECGMLFFQRKEDFYDKLDERKDLIGFTNGVYDFSQKRFRAGLPSDFLTKSVGYDYVPTSNQNIRTNIHEIIQNIMSSSDMRDYLIDTIASSIHGDKVLEQMFFWIGSGANGRGLVETLCKLTFGQYFCAPRPSIYTTNKLLSNSDLLNIKSKRILISRQAKSGGKLQIGFLNKFITSRDKIQGKSMQMIPQSTIMMIMNNLPKLTTYDSDIKNSIKIIRFPFKFVDNPNPHNIFEKKIDTSLIYKICEDVRYRQEFMLMLIERYHKFAERGYELTVPQNVVNDTSKYFKSNT